ncbi:MAG: serine hydrolase [Planctomycetota bacterium]
MTDREIGWVGCVITALALVTLEAKAEEITRGKVDVAIPLLEKVAKETLTRTGVPGMAFGIVYKDQVLYLKGLGVREAGKPEPVDADTVFQVASVSKPITTTVLARLVGEGKIGWNDRVIDHMPEFRLYDSWVTREVRLRDFLCHRSGLPDQAGDLLEDMGYGRGEVLRRLRFQPLASSFRSEYAYTNFGFTAAAEAAARAEGMAWEDLCEQKLFEPLGMTATSARFSDFEKASNRVKLHVRVDGQWVPKFVRQPDAQAPAGGVSSNVRDMTQWLRLQLAGGKFDGKLIVDSKALADTHAPSVITGFHPDDNRPGLYGLGWGIVIDPEGRVFWRHSGAFFLGIRTEVALLPAEQLGIVVLTNAAPTGVPEAINDSFFDLVFHGKLGTDWVELWNGRFDQLVKQMYQAQTDYSHPPAPPSPAMPVKSYTGRYQNDYFGALEILETNGSLMLKLGPRKMSFPLRHWDRDTFTYLPTGESASGTSGCIFTLDAKNVAQKVLLEALNGNGLGTFQRVGEP